MVEDKNSFLSHFITTFLASWCAANYDDACMRGHHETLENPPVEDAVILAFTAWKKLEETGSIDQYGRVYFREDR